MGLRAVLDQDQVVLAAPGVEFGHRSGIAVQVREDQSSDLGRRLCQGLLRVGSGRGEGVHVHVHRDRDESGATGRHGGEAAVVGGHEHAAAWWQIERGQGDHECVAATGHPHGRSTVDVRRELFFESLDS